MIWVAFLALLGSQADGDPAVPKAPPVVQMTISAKLDRNGRWCSASLFEATIKNAGDKAVWLDLGKASDEIEPRSYSVEYMRNSGGSYEGRVIGSTHDWGSIEYLRSPEATLLKSGESVCRMVKLDGVRLRAGQITVHFSLRIHGTDNLDDPKVHAYEPEDTVRFRTRRRGACIEVRRLTKR